MNLFGWLNVTFSVLIAALVVYKMGWLQDKLIATELFGLGLLGGGMVLNIAPILRGVIPFIYVENTPFDDWGSTLLRAGIFLYLFGRTSRQWKHDANNKAHIELYRAEAAKRRETKASNAS